MPAYKDVKKGTWYVKFSYKDWTGTPRWTTKRGFSTKREALQYESEYKLHIAGDVNMSFSEFVKVYRENQYPRIRVSTQATKDLIIDKKLIPYFGKKKVAEITVMDIIKWQNEMMAATNPQTMKPYTTTYLRTIHNQLKAIMNFAARFYNLKENPVEKAGNIGTIYSEEMNFWTLDEYKTFSETIKDNPMAYHCFEILYWTGIREGELLALSRDDFDLDAKTISITKTYQVVKGKEFIGPPKTGRGRRIVQMPYSLAKELQDYFDMHCESTGRLFPITKNNLYYVMKKGCRNSGVKRIRVHDLRHSHISLLISMGFTPVDIAKRVGHENITITLRYAHMFPNVQINMANVLEKLMEGKDNGYECS